MPGLYDLNLLFGGNNSKFIEIIMKFNFMLMNLFTSKLYMPAMSILINIKIEKAMRAGLNSIFFLGTSFLTMFVYKINDFAMNGSFDDLVAPPSEIYKYYAILLFVGF